MMVGDAIGEHLGEIPLPRHQPADVGVVDPNQLCLHLYVPNADATYQRAVSAGATSTMEMTDQFYGDRSGSVKDPAGNTWFIATHKEDVTPQELKKRAEAMYKQGKAA